MPFPIVPYLWEASAAQPVSLLQRRLTEPYPAHGHDYFELELVVSGSGRQWLNGEALSMEPGCLYLLSPADFHRLEPNASLDVFSFHFTPEYAAQLGFSLVQEARHTQISSEKTAQFAARLSPLAKPSAAVDLFYQQELLILLLPLLLRLLRQGEAMQLRKPERRFQAGLKYVQAHHTDPELRLEDAARACGLSPCYFSSLLSASSVPVTEAAYEAGFSSLPHFFRCFQKRFGVSPGVFRKQSAPLPSDSANFSVLPLPIQNSSKEGSP